MSDMSSSSKDVQSQQNGVENADQLPIVIPTTLPFEIVDVETDYEKSNNQIIFFEIGNSQNYKLACLM